jgi:hypothetical protein
VVSGTQYDDTITIDAVSRTRNTVDVKFTDPRTGRLIDTGPIRTDFTNINTVRVNGLGGDNRVVFTNAADLSGVNYVIYGGPGNNVLDASKTQCDVTLIGGSGNDTLYGGNGKDVLIGSDAKQLPDGTWVPDPKAGPNNHLLIAGTGFGQKLYGGGRGSETLIGGSGPNQVLVAGDGDDALIAGTGVNQTLKGGAGNDQLVINAATGANPTLDGTGGYSTMVYRAASGENIVVFDRALQINGAFKTFNPINLAATTVEYTGTNITARAATINDVANWVSEGHYVDSGGTYSNYTTLKTFDFHHDQSGGNGDWSDTISWSQDARNIYIHYWWQWNDHVDSARVWDSNWTSNSVQLHTHGDGVGSGGFLGIGRTTGDIHVWGYVTGYTYVPHYVWVDTSHWVYKSGNYGVPSRPVITNVPTLFNVPADIVVQPASAAGAVVTYTLPTAHDGGKTDPAVTASVPSGAVFPIGKTTVTLTARGVNGGVATRSFTVTVSPPTTAPVLANVPASITVEATSPAGAAVNLAPTATDSFGNKLSVLTSTAPAWSDNFSSYAANSNLIGQGGWTAGPGSSKLVVNQGAIDGQTDPGTGKMEVAQHLLPAAGNAGTLDLSFGTLAYSSTAYGLIRSPNGANLEAGYIGPARPAPLAAYGPTRSHNSAVGLGTADTALGAVWVPDTNYSVPGSSYYTYPVWEFDARGITGNPQAIVTLPESVSRQDFDKNVTFHVIVDCVNNLVYGTYDFGNGVSGETARFAVKDPSKLDRVTVMEDYRYTPRATNNASYASLGTRVMNMAVTYSAGIPAYGHEGVTLSRPSGSVFAVGTTPVTVTARDAAGNTTTATINVTVKDDMLPVITAPDVVAEATGPNGAAVNFTGVVVKDVSDAHPKLTFSRPDGSVFAIGQTAVTVTVTDAAGYSNSKTFNVIVKDTTPPTLANVPKDMVLEATSAKGAVATFAMPTAKDIVDPNPTVTVSQASGTTFALGTTTVTVTATDKAGNKTTATFKVTARDTTPPTLPTISDIVAEATGPGGAIVNFTLPAATDLVDAKPVVTASRASGSLFPIGTTAVTVTATDAAGNRTTRTFNVIVRDTTPPKLTVPANITVQATSSGGAVVTFAAPTATDTVEAHPTVTVSKASGTLFPLGTTTVTVQATDAAGNTTTATFTVTVQASTTTTVQLSKATSNVGDAVTITATVKGGAIGTPGGTVTFRDGTATLGTATLVNGVATLTTTALAAGGHSITAVYAGAGGFTASTSAALTETVNRLATQTTLSAAASYSYGFLGIALPSSTTLTATVKASGTPTGTVTFMDGTTVLGTVKVGANGVAQLSVYLSRGITHKLTAVYAGDATFEGSTSAVSLF